MGASGSLFLGHGTVSFLTIGCEPAEAKSLVANRWHEKGQRANCCCMYVACHGRPVSLFACLPACLPACLSVSLSLCLCLFLSVCVSLSFSLSLPLSLSLSPPLSLSLTRLFSRVVSPEVAGSIPPLHNSPLYEVLRHGRYLKRAPKTFGGKCKGKRNVRTPF